MKKIRLENNIPVVIKENKNTPRPAVCFYFKMTNPENKAGVYSLLNRLFLQGTKNRTSAELANELDENAIDCYCEMKHDYIRFKLQFLNEDMALALEILADIIKNSTLADFDKEVIKLKGEITAQLDNPKSKAMDIFYMNIFKNHPYGNSCTKIMQEIDDITQNDVQLAYEDMLNNSYKVISVVGDVDENVMIEMLSKHFSDLQNPDSILNNTQTPVFEKNEVVKIVKNDASQAQIIQGWHVPTIYDKDYAAITLMNTMLGASGLSSRLFLELRDKKGLAYVVRSCYEIYEKAGLFSVYIATEPKNIKTSLDGFKIELGKIKNELISQQELDNAKNNLIGKRQFFTETNLQQASLMAYYEDKGLGYDYESKFIEQIKSVTIDDIKRVANICLNDPSLLTVLAPEEYMNFD